MYQRHRGFSSSGQAPRFREPDGGLKRATFTSSRRVERGKSWWWGSWQKPWLPTTLMVLVLVVLLFYWRPEWLVALSTNRRSSSQAQSSKSHQYDEDLKPRSDNTIFTAFTRRKKAAIAKMSQEFSDRVQEGRLTPCRLDTDCLQTTAGGGGILPVVPLLRFSSSRSAKIILHNSLPFHRYICDKVIWGDGGTVELEGNDIHRCLSDNLPYVQSARPPPVSGKEMRPVELFWNYEGLYFYDYYEGNSDEAFETKEFQCAIPCRTAGSYALLSVIAVKDTNWEILSTMEGEKYYAQARVQPKSYRQDQYYAVTSFQSEIPLPYFSWDEYNIQHSPVNFDKVIKGASFLAKNCESESKREELLLALMATSLRVDSLSDCHNNAKPPRGVDMSNKTAVLEQYLFHFAFENQRTNDYITEKLWGALAAGTLPVYWGAPNVKDHVPPHSVIFVEDFATPQDLAAYLVKLTQDKDLYNSYHTWRGKPLDSSFRDKYDFTRIHSTCRMCHWAYAKRHGLGWNHARQQVEEPHIPHKTCRNKIGLVGHPFKEYWLAGSDGKAVGVKSDAAIHTCTLDASNRIVQIDNGAIQRKVFDQDGITDLIIDPLKMDGRTYLLKLETPIVTTELKKIDDKPRQEWWLQDTYSRITILTSWPVELELVKQGTVQLLITKACRIRIIVEDVDMFHKGAKKYVNYFGDVMRQDFFTPIEAYIVSPPR